MKVLLTGSAGFIGSAIDRALQARGDDVVRVDLMLPSAHRAPAAPGGTHRLDVRDASSWTGLIAAVDVVCHQAALVGLGVDASDQPAFASHNDLGTATLLAAMHEVGVRRLVLASSMVVYGEGRYVCVEHGLQRPGPRPETTLDSGRFENRCPVCGAPLGWGLVEEQDRLEPRSSYAASKLAQELYTAAWARQSAGAAVALRYHNVYGPAMPQDNPYSGVAAMFRSALERGVAPRVFEDGGQMRDFVHVDDVARANLMAIDSVLEVAPGTLSTYNICSGTPISILEVARLIAGSGPEPFVTGEYRLGDVRHIVASPSRARAGLGFTAAIQPSDGLPVFAGEALRP